LGDGSKGFGLLKIEGRWQLLFAGVGLKI